MVEENAEIGYTNLREGFWEAGKDYLAALKKLGLNPEALLWAYDEVVEKHVLVLITPMYDVAGSLSLTRTMVKAYNLAATPKEISPFIVRLHSSDQTIAQKMRKADINATTQVDKTLKDYDQKKIDVCKVFQIGGLIYKNDWVYKFDIKKRDSITTLRQWKRFNDNVEKLAKLAA